MKITFPPGEKPVFPSWGECHRHDPSREKARPNQARPRAIPVNPFVQVSSVRLPPKRGCRDFPPGIGGPSHTATPLPMMPIPRSVPRRARYGRRLLYGEKSKLKRQISHHRSVAYTAKYRAVTGLMKVNASSRLLVIADASRKKECIASP